MCVDFLCHISAKSALVPDFPLRHQPRSDDHGEEVVRLEQRDHDEGLRGGGGGGQQQRHLRMDFLFVFCLHGIS